MRGGERQVKLLHEGLCAVGVDSTLVCRRGSALHTELRSAVAVQWRGPLDPVGLLRLYRTIARARPSLVHCHDSHALSHGALVAAALGLPLVATRRVVFAPSRGPFTCWKYRRCEAVIAISDAVRKQCGLLVDLARCHVVHSAVPVGTDEPDRQASRQMLCLAPDAYVVGSVGHFTGEKQLDLIAAVARGVAAAEPGIVIACVGPSMHTPEQLPGNLVMAGPVEAASRYYAAFDAYLSASRAEGLGTALVDAVVRDIPAMATDAGGTRDIFPEGWPLRSVSDAAGLIQDVIEAYRDRGAAACRAREAGERARELFSPSRMVVLTQEVYRNVLAGHAQERGMST